MYTKIYKGYEIYFSYAFDSYAARPIGTTNMKKVPYFENRGTAEKYADEHPLEMDVSHDVIEIEKNGLAVKAVFNVYHSDFPLRPLKTFMHAKSEREMIHKIAVYLGVKHRLEPEQDFFEGLL